MEETRKKVGHMPSNMSALQAKLEKSYCPYSKKRVACLVITKDGDNFFGVNVENASFGLTTCAEAAAICSAVTKNGPKMRIKHIIVCTDSMESICPCGSCRQIIHEFSDESTLVSCIGNNNVVSTQTAHGMLPNAFKF